MAVYDERACTTMRTGFEALTIALYDFSRGNERAQNAIAPSGVFINGLMQQLYNFSPLLHG